SGGRRLRHRLRPVGDGGPRDARVIAGVYGAGTGVAPRPRRDGRAESTRPGRAVVQRTADVVHRGDHGHSVPPRLRRTRTRPTGAAASLSARHGEYDLSVSAREIDAVSPRCSTYPLRGSGPVHRTRRSEAADQRHDTGGATPGPT